MKTKDFLTGHRGVRLKTVNEPYHAVISISGRVSVIASFFVFVGCYLFGIIHYGIVPGVAIGWLPSGLIAWLCAHAVFDLTQIVLRILPSFKRTS